MSRTSNEEVAQTPVDIRTANAADVPWIYSSWLKSFREHGSGIGRINKESFFQHHRALMLQVTSRSGVVTLVACPSENTEQILGWLCGEKMPNGRVVLHYGHVKSERRRQGVMRALVEAFDVTRTTPVFYTHHTKVWWRDQHNTPKAAPLADIVPASWNFNPYLFA